MLVRARSRHAAIAEAEVLQRPDLQHLNRAGELALANLTKARLRLGWIEVGVVNLPFLAERRADENRRDALLGAAEHRSSGTYRLVVRVGVHEHHGKARLVGH